MSAYVPSFSHPSVNSQVLLVNRPEGVAQPGDFRIETAPIPAVGEGRFLVRNIYLSVEPAQRGWAADGTSYTPAVPLGTPMRALGVGQIVESRDPAFPAGGFVYGFTGWQDYAVLSAAEVLTHFAEPEVSLSAYGGVLGINGLTAYIALHRLGQPQPGETLLVSTAAGAVGSAVGQLGKAAGCRTVGLTGDDAKVGRCLSVFGYDAAANYKTRPIEETLTDIAPEGIDIYFDNVGGAMLDATLRRMKDHGRIIESGTTSIASWTPAPTGLRNEREVMKRRLIWAGFVIFDHLARFNEVTSILAGMIRSGSLVFEEHITNGIETAPDSLRALYAGENEGKRLIFLG